LNQTIDEENALLRNQIKNKTKALVETKEEYLKLQEAHKRILYKRRVHKLRKGKCFYILKNKDVLNKTKIGKTINLNSRRSGYQTYFDPDFLYICFSEHYNLIESCVKVKYFKSIAECGEEWIIDVSDNEVIEFVENIIKTLDISCEVYRCLEDIIVDENPVIEETSSTEIEIQSNKTDESDDIMIEITDDERVENDNIDCAEFIYTKEVKTNTTIKIENKPETIQVNSETKDEKDAVNVKF